MICQPITSNLQRIYEYIGVILQEQTAPTQEITSTAKEVEPTTQKPDSSTPVPATVKTTQQQVTDSTAVPPTSGPSAQTSTPAGKLFIAMNEVNIIISLTFVRETVHSIYMYLVKTCAYIYILYTIHMQHINFVAQ